MAARKLNYTVRPQARRFVPVTPGTKRAKVVSIFARAAARQMTLDDLARTLKTTAGAAKNKVYCMHRDNGFGYYVRGRVIGLIVPKGRDPIRRAEKA